MDRRRDRSPVSRAMQRLLVPDQLGKDGASPGGSRNNVSERDDAREDAIGRPSACGAETLSFRSFMPASTSLEERDGSSIAVDSSEGRAESRRSESCDEGMGMEQVPKGNDSIQTAQHGKFHPTSSGPFIERRQDRGRIERADRGEEATISPQRNGDSEGAAHYTEHTSKQNGEDERRDSSKTKKARGKSHSPAETKPAEQLSGRDCRGRGERQGGGISAGGDGEEGWREVVTNPGAAVMCRNASLTFATTGLVGSSYDSNASSGTEAASKPTTGSNSHLGSSSNWGSKERGTIKQGNSKERSSSKQGSSKERSSKQGSSKERSSINQGSSSQSSTEPDLSISSAPDRIRTGLLGALNASFPPSVAPRRNVQPVAVAALRLSLDSSEEASHHHASYGGTAASPSHPPHPVACEACTLNGCSHIDSSGGHMSASPLSGRCHCSCPETSSTPSGSRAPIASARSPGAVAAAGISDRGGAGADGLGFDSPASDGRLSSQLPAPLLSPSHRSLRNRARGQSPPWVDQTSPTSTTAALNPIPPSSAGPSPPAGHLHSASADGDMAEQEMVRQSEGEAEEQDFMAGELDERIRRAWGINTDKRSDDALRAAESTHLALLGCQLEGSGRGEGSQGGSHRGGYHAAEEGRDAVRFGAGRKGKATGAPAQEEGRGVNARHRGRKSVGLGTLSATAELAAAESTASELSAAAAATALDASAAASRVRRVQRRASRSADLDSPLQGHPDGEDLSKTEMDRIISSWLDPGGEGEGEGEGDQWPREEGVQGRIGEGSGDAIESHMRESHAEGLQAHASRRALRGKRSVGSRAFKSMDLDQDEMARGFTFALPAAAGSAKLASKLEPQMSVPVPRGGVSKQLLTTAPRGVVTAAGAGSQRGQQRVPAAKSWDVSDPCDMDSGLSSSLPEFHAVVAMKDGVEERMLQQVQSQQHGQLTQQHGQLTQQHGQLTQQQDEQQQEGSVKQQESGPQESSLLARRSVRSIQSLSVGKPPSRLTRFSSFSPDSGQPNSPHFLPPLSPRTPTPPLSPSHPHGAPSYSHSHNAQGRRSARTRPSPLQPSSLTHHSPHTPPMSPTLRSAPVSPHYHSPHQFPRTRPPSSLSPVSSRAVQAPTSNATAAATATAATGAAGATHPFSPSASPRSRIISPACPSTASLSTRGNQPSQPFNSAADCLGTENWASPRSSMRNFPISGRGDGVSGSAASRNARRPAKQNSLDVGALASERERLMHAGSGTFYTSDMGEFDTSGWDRGGGGGGGGYVEQSGRWGGGRASFDGQTSTTGGSNTGDSWSNSSSRSRRGGGVGYDRVRGNVATRHLVLSGAGTAGAHSSNIGSTSGGASTSGGLASVRPAGRRLPAVSVNEGSSFLAASSTRDNLGDFQLEGLSSCQLAYLIAAERESAGDQGPASQTREGRGKAVGVGAVAGGLVRDYGRRQSAYATLWTEEEEEDGRGDAGRGGGGRDMQAPSMRFPGGAGSSAALMSKKATDVVTAFDLPGMTGASEWEHAVLGSIQELSTSGSSSSGRTSSGSFQERRRAGMGVILRPLSGMGAKEIPSDHILRQAYERVESRYALQREELGSGQYGVIRKCMEIKTGRVYACKTMKKEGIRTFDEAEDIRKEVASLRLLFPHPNIVELKDTFEDEKSVHLVMELCRGGDLFDRLIDRGTLSEPVGARLCKALIEVLLHCHSHGVVHRDVKPENILLVDKSSDTNIKLLDFGVATFFKRGKKMTEVIGTPEYMAPEQIKGRYGPEVDIWSAGVVMYLAMGGVPPFWASSRDAVKKAIVEKEVSFKYPTWLTVSEDCKDCIGKLLVKEPLRRATPHEMLGHRWIRKWSR